MAYVNAEAWVRQVEEQYKDVAVFETALTNKHYDGEIKQNATVHVVHTPGTVDVFDYTGPWEDGDWDDYSETKTDFTISQKKAVRIKVEREQSLTSLKGLLQSAAQDTAYELAKKADQYIGGLYSGITTNTIGTTAAPQAIGFDESAGEMLPSIYLSDSFEKITASGGVTSGLNKVVPPWFAKALRWEIKNRNTGLGDAVLRGNAGQGKLDLGGSVEGWDGIFVSNNVYTAADGGAGANETYWKVMGGNPNNAITFARRMTEQEFLKMQNGFVDLLKALHIYGGLVVREKHMVLGTIKKGKWPNGLSL